METIVNFAISLYLFSIAICAVSYSARMIADRKVNEVYKGYYGILWILFFISIAPFLVFYMMYNFTKKKFEHVTVFLNSMLIIAFICNYFLHTETSLTALMIFSTIFLFLQTVWVIEIRRLTPKKHDNNR